MSNDQPAHKRIDAGIKRGKRQNMPIAANRISQDRLEPFDKGRLANLDVERVVERFIGGETSTQIAASYGVTRQGLTWWLRSHAEEHWKESQIVQAIERKDRAEDMLEAASDSLSLARARELLRGAQWELERMFSKHYGQKQEVTGKDGGPLQVQIVRFGQTIEGQATVSSDTQCTAQTPVLPLIQKD